MLSVEDLKTKSVFEIKSFAKKNNINLGTAKTKVEMLNILQGKEEVKVEPKQDLTEKIALYSNNNKHNSEIGSLKTGYNIVTKEVATKWLAFKGVRIADPGEVASYYGK